MTRPARDEVRPIRDEIERRILHLLDELGVSATYEAVPSGSA